VPDTWSLRAPSSMCIRVIASCQPPMPAKSRITPHTASTGPGITVLHHTLFGGKPAQRVAPSGFVRPASDCFSAFQPPWKTPFEMMSTYLPASSGASSNTASHSAKVVSFAVTGISRTRAT